MNALWRAVVIVGALAVVPLWIVGLRAEQGYYGINPATVDISPAATWTVTVDPDSPAAIAGIVNGDEIPFAHLDPSTRRQLSPNFALAGLSVTFEVNHNAGSRRVTLKPTGIPVFPLSLNNGLFVAISIIAAILGFLLTVRSWNDGRARIAATMLVLLALDGTTEAAPLQQASTVLVWLEFFWGVGVYLVNLAAWAFLSVVLVSTFPTARSRAFDWLFKLSGALAVLGAAQGLYATHLVVTAMWTERDQPLAMLYAVPYAVSATAVIVGYLHSEAEDRQRLFWLVLAFVPFQAGVAILSFLSFGGTQLNATLLMRIFELSLPIFMLYGILVRRVVDAGFVINRLTVYGILTVLVVATFIIVETLLNTFVAGMSRTSSLVTQIGIALFLGLMIRYPHRYVDHWVDRLFFVKRHADEQELRQFAHETKVYAGKETLLDHTIERLHEHTEAGGLGIYINNGKTVPLVRRDVEGLPEIIPIDDPALISMRRWDQPLDVHRVKTVLPDGMVFPLSSHGKVLGILFCGTKRDATAFAPDEREPILEVARGVGSALDTLTAQSEEIVDPLLRAIAALPDAIVERLKASHLEP